MEDNQVLFGQARHQIAQADETFPVTMAVAVAPAVGRLGLGKSEEQI